MEIEKNIPIPEQHKYGKNKAILQKMEVGDSFLLKNQTSNPNQVWNTVASRLRMKITVRKVADGQYRVWRVE